MATAGDAAPAGLAPDRVERILATAAVVLLAAALIAIARGHAEWVRVPPLIRAHLASVLTALALTPVMLLRRRGDARHRLLGRIWCAAMWGTAVLSLGITSSRPGHFSLIHILSLFVIVQVPIIVVSARQHNLRRHRGAVRGMVIGALLIAGAFTFPFDRLMGHWLFG